MIRSKYWPMQLLLECGFIGNKHYNIFFSLNSSDDKEYTIMTGQLEDEDILLKASEVKIKSATITKGFLQIQTEHISWLTFDYDMQIKEKTDVVVGKNYMP